jgi:hypothetical protein
MFTTFTPYRPTRQGDAPQGSSRAVPKLTLHEGEAKERKRFQRRIDKNGVTHTFTTGPTWSITCLITSTARFHDFTVSMASSAESSIRDISFWPPITGPTGVPPPMGRSPVRNEGDNGALTCVDCMISLLDWTIKHAAPPSAARSSRSSVLGFRVLPAAAAGEELASGDMTIVKESVTGSVEFLVSPSGLPKTMSISTHRTLSQTRR